MRRHLKKVLASSEFARSERAGAFLKFIVAHALDQDSGALKERPIGVAVFERPEDWDPKLDTTVRTEARRLRKKLADYYASPAGEDQFVCIDVPLGAYVPKFRFLETAEQISISVALPGNPEKSENIEAIQQPLMPGDFVNTPPPRKLVFTRWIPMLCSLAGICLIAFLVIAVRSRRSVQSLPSFQTIPLTSEYGDELAPSISPDSSQIAYVWDGGTSEYRIYIRSVTGGSPRRLTASNSTELSPAFSPNGKQIAYLRVQEGTTEVIVRNLSDGSEHLVGDIATQIGDWTGDPGPLIGNLGPAWTSDGGNLIVADLAPNAASNGIFTINLSNGSRRQLTTNQDSIQDFLPKVSRDGHTLAFVRAVTHGISDLYLLDLTTNALTRVTDENHSINGLAWSRGNDKIIISSNREGPYQLWVLDLANRSFQKLDTESATAIDPQIALDSDWMAYVTTTQNWNIDQVLLDGSPTAAVTRFIASSGRNHSGRYSPDGRHVAFVSDRSGAWEIWLCQVDCTEPQKLTSFNGPWIGGLSWSPDSTRLAFDARPGRKSAIYTLSITHPTPEILENNSYEERMPSWSVDGSAIYFDSDRDGSVSVFRRDLATGKTQKVGPGFMARELDTGGRLLIGRSDGTIWEVARPGDAEQPLLDKVVADPVLAWTTHGRALYYCYSEKDGSVRVAQFEDGRKRTVGRSLDPSSSDECKPGPFTERPIAVAHIEGSLQQQYLPTDWATPIKLDPVS